MPERAESQTEPATRRYRGSITDPDRWDHFAPRPGDVVLATPAKSGTTWTQSMIAMLLHGTPELPDILGAVSPWFDASFEPVDKVVASLSTQSDRRVIKTHTPVDGWPVWNGVSVVAVFRHPLEVFLSIRKHLANLTRPEKDNPLSGPFDQALDYFLNEPFSADRIDSDTLRSILRHFEAAVLSDRWAHRLVLNYAAMSRDHAGTLAKLNAFLGTEADPDLLARIQGATEFGAMKARARDFAPEAGGDFWRDDKAFFANGRSGAWRDSFTEAQIAAYQSCLSDLLPDPAHRRWIETGHGNV